ncbi:MAG: MBL fold metallo-hydrolase [Bacteroidales bacterium]|nr:MBL fold metallo-hydrolase [Bacteroidales bacterium]
MKISFLGTGTSQGVPIIGCECPVCKSIDPKDQRLRSSVLIETQDTTLVIDTGPDFRQQMLRINQKNLDTVVFTHDHKDHTAGLDDVRAFNFIQKKAMQVYGEAYVLNTIKREFSYAFADYKYPGVPEIHLNEINEKPFYINQTLITPIRGIHYKLPVLGFKIGNFAYITDMNFIDDSEIEKFKNIDTLVINALRREKHISHFCLDGALKIIKKSNVKQAYLTHISHKLGLYKEVSKELPKNVHLAYDGLIINI